MAASRSARSSRKDLLIITHMLKDCGLKHNLVVCKLSPDEQTYVPDYFISLNNFVCFLEHCAQHNTTPRKLTSWDG